MFHRLVYHGIFTGIELQFEPMYLIAFRNSDQWSSQYLMSEFLQSLIAFKVFLERVEGVLEEACDADNTDMVLLDIEGVRELSSLENIMT